MICYCIIYFQLIIQFLSIIMPKPFIRPLSVKYHDFLQKTYQQQLPYKFQEEEDDDYKEKRHVKRESYIRIQNPEPVKQVKSTSCYLCSCLNLQLCENCQNMLCESCKNSFALKFMICEKCKQNLCSDCKNTLHGNKKIKLRNYKINLKRIKDLHFRDCQCQECAQYNQKWGNQNIKSHLNVNSQIKKTN